MRFLYALLVMLSLPLAAWADDLPTGGVSAPEVAAALQKAGYPADVTADHSGVPTIRGSTGKVLFFVHFYQCGAELRCASVEFTAAFQHNHVTAATIGAWNREERFGRAYLDTRGIAWVAMDVDTSRGMTPEVLLANSQRWITVLNGFGTFIAR